MLRERREPDLREIDIEGKGKGVICSRRLEKGQFVCEYAGDLISEDEALEREAKYAKEVHVHCYMYFLRHNGINMCVDATHAGRIGRLINHSRLRPNLATKLFVVDDIPRLGLVAIKVSTNIQILSPIFHSFKHLDLNSLAYPLSPDQDISVGEELHYDYGDRDNLG